MSKKHIARTAIEGGRYWGNQVDRRLSTRGERAAVREWIGADDFEARAIPERQPVGKRFRDKLAVPLRWLRSHDGASWDDVYAELKRRFDSRTTAGRHIVYCHMLRWVVPVSWVHELNSRWSWVMVVDDDGILHWQGHRPRHRRALPPGKVWRSAREVAAWAGDRKVGLRGNTLFWFEPVAFGWVPCQDLFCKRHQVPLPHTKRVPEIPEDLCRQARRLSEDEVKYWNTLTLDVQKTLWYPHIQVTVH